MGEGEIDTKSRGSWFVVNGSATQGGAALRPDPVQLTCMDGTLGER